MEVKGNVWISATFQWEGSKDGSMKDFVGDEQTFDQIRYKVLNRYASIFEKGGVENMKLNEISVDDENDYVCVTKEELFPKVDWRMLESFVKEEVSYESLEDAIKL